MHEDKDCIYYCKKYVQKIQNELDGCSADYKMDALAFPTFNHLSVYFPEAYKHMLEVWGIANA